MRVCLASAARVLTLFTLALLSSHSFILANAQANPQGTNLANIPGAGGDGGSSVGGSSSSSAVIHSSTTVVTTPSPTPTPTTQSTTSQHTPTTTSSPSPSPTPKTSSAEGRSSSSSANTPTTSTGPSDSSSQTSSAPTSVSSTSSVSASSSPSSSSTSSFSTSLPSSTGPVTQSHPETTLVVSPTAVNGHSYAGPDPTTYNWLSSTPSATGAAAGNVSASSKSFFDNKGAVAGTFSVVGVFALGAVIVGVIYAKRRAARLQDEEDMTYFEKYNASNGDNQDGPADLSFGNENPSEAQIMTHAPPDAYPDRSMHYGLPTMEEYAQPQPMGLTYGAAQGTGAGVEYPPGTAYARAQAQQGQQYQYDGQMGGYGADYSAQYQEAYYDLRRSPSSATHPYADPRNSPRADGAPPVQPHGSSAENVELVQGEAR
ncbi:hypothetical protein BD414DRAFT_452707 [Trametes punicea]|nr:hypothetical protein BD414DRAFT_452707 [Trametes punicea]